MSTDVVGAEKTRPSILWRIGQGAAALAVAAVLALVLVIPGPMIAPDAELSSGIVFTEIDGRDAAVLTYDDDGFAGLGVFFNGVQPGRIIAIDVATGAVIRQDKLVDAEESALWRRALSLLSADDGNGDEFAPAGSDEPARSDEVLVGSVRMRLGVPEGSPPGTPTLLMTRDGRALGDAEFVYGSFVMAASAQGRGAVGAAHGHLLVEHARSAGTDHRRLSVVDTETGTVVATTPAEIGTLIAAVAPTGQTVLGVERLITGALPSPWRPAESAVVVLLQADGSLQEIPLSPHGWLGLPW